MGVRSSGRREEEEERLHFVGFLPARHADRARQADGSTAATWELDTWFFGVSAATCEVV
jgi:hypothetical protein